MFGIKTGPSFMQNMAGAGNALAQKYGNPNMRGMVQASGAIAGAMNNRRAANMGAPRRGMPIRSGIPAGQMPGTPMPMPQMPINTAPSQPPMMSEPMAGGGMMMPPMRNTGITGGMGGGLFNRFRQY